MAFFLVNFTPLVIRWPQEFLGNVTPISMAFRSGNSIQPPACEGGTQLTNDGGFILQCEEKLQKRQEKNWLTWGKNPLYRKTLFQIAQDVSHVQENYFVAMAACLLATVAFSESIAFATMPENAGSPS